MPWGIVVFFILAMPAFAGEALSYHAIDEMQEKARAYMATLQSQRNAALDQAADQIVALTTELAKKSKECKAK